MKKTAVEKQAGVMARRARGWSFASEEQRAAMVQSFVKFLSTKGKPQDGIESGRYKAVGDRFPRNHAAVGENGRIACGAKNVPIGRVAETWAGVDCALCLRSK